MSLYDFSQQLVKKIREKALFIGCQNQLYLFVLKGYIVSFKTIIVQILIDPVHIGFSDFTEREIARLISKGKKIETLQEDYYIHIFDPSGPEIYFQFSKSSSLLGYNAHFLGRTSFPVAAIKKIIRNESPLDGALLCWAAPESPADPETGLFPFAFDVPDFYGQKVLKESFPQSLSVQIAAFPEKQPFLFNSENHFMEVIGNKAKIAPASVIPSGLFKKNEDYQSKAFVNGIIKNVDKITNGISEVPFYHLIVETAGGNIDILSAINALPVIPNQGSVISGDFWLSAKLLERIK